MTFEEFIGALDEQREFTESERSSMQSPRCPHCAGRIRITWSTQTASIAETIDRYFIANYDCGCSQVIPDE
jgi:hypothetical protein